MFKMGCSMARRILTPGSAASGDQQQAGCFSAAAAASSSNSNNSTSNKNNAGRNADQAPKAGQPSSELDDFSKLKEDPRLPLNVRQIFKITKSWKAIARTTSKTGTAMFLALFEQNENLFHLFDRFQHLKGKELHESMELREHAATVMATLDTSINSLSDYDNFVSYLHSIGQLHRKVPGFKREYFWEIEQPFMKAVKQTLDERCNETIEEIYKIAIKLIIETIAVGYGEDQDNGEPGRGNAPGGPDKSRQSGGGGGGSDADNKTKGETSNNKSENKPAERIAGGGGGQRTRQCQQTPSERSGAPKCPLVLAKRVLWRLGRSANKLTPENVGGQPKLTGELVRATCKLMSAASVSLVASCGETRLGALEQGDARLMKWRSLLVDLNRSLMNTNEIGEQAKEEQQDGQTRADQRRHSSMWLAGMSRTGGCPIENELVDFAQDGQRACGPHDDCGRTHLGAAETAPDDGGRSELDRDPQLGITREVSDGEKQVSRAINPIESQASNWAADSRQTAAQDKLKKCPRGDHEGQTPTGVPRDRRSSGPPAEAPLGLDANEASDLEASEANLRRLFLEVKRRELASEVVDEAELMEFIKVIVLISKLQMALASSRAAATMTTARQAQTTLPTSLLTTTFQ